MYQSNKVAIFADTVTWAGHMDHSAGLIKKVSSVLEETLSIPMWGHIPMFPWESLCATLQDTFTLSNVAISPVTSDWKKEDELLEGLGDHPIMTPLTMAPLAPSLFWVMGKEDVEKLTKTLVDKEGKRSFVDEDFQKGFFKFSMLQILKTFDRLKPYPGLTPKMHSTPLVPQSSYCVDVTISLNDEELLGRLICPMEFHRVFTSHFSSRPFSLDYVDSSIELLLHIQVGSVKIKFNEWNTVTPGDVLILDKCSYHPNTKQGSFFITLGTIPLFIAKSKNHELKILDYALYEPEDSFMTEDNDDDIQEEMFEDEESESSEEEDSVSEDESPVEELLSAQDVPLSLCIEIAQIKMSLKELLHLKPGNTLQLPVSIEQGVSVTLNSKVIARGELLQLGDLLGVKISEISH